MRKVSAQRSTIANHGIEGADVSVRVRTSGNDLRGMAKALAALGIGVAA